MWNFHVWRTLVWPLCNGSEWWWYLWKGNLSLFWTNQTRLLSLAWFWSCGRMKKKKWDFDHLPEMTLCTVQRSPRGKQNYFSYGPFNGLSDPHTFVPARHTFQICRLNHIRPFLEHDGSMETWIHKFSNNVRHCHLGRFYRHKSSAKGKVEKT